MLAAPPPTRRGGAAREDIDHLTNAGEEELNDRSSIEMGVGWGG